MIPFDQIFAFLGRGGPALWVIAILSVITVAIILWKIWQLLGCGAWRTGASENAVDLWQAGRQDAAISSLSGRTGMRAAVARGAMSALQNERYTPEQAREETARLARRQMGRARAGLRALELIATIAPLLGLLGTVLGMIEAFQALQESGNRADAAALAGGIWEALLTTAAGMAVAIPAGIALSWFDSVADRLQADMEDAAIRIFTHSEPDTPAP